MPAIDGIVNPMTSTENAYTDIAWTTHIVGVYRRQLRRGEPCPAAHARLVAVLAAAEAALTAMRED